MLISNAINISIDICKNYIFLLQHNNCIANIINSNVIKMCLNKNTFKCDISSAILFKIKDAVRIL